MEFMKIHLVLAFFLAGVAGQAATLSFSGVLDPANVAFCTDPNHPVCVELLNITFSGVNSAPNQVIVQDGFSTVYSYNNVYYSVDPGGLTFSGGIAPNEAFSVTNAQNVDLQSGLFRLNVVGDISVGIFEVFGVDAPAPAPVAPPLPPPQALTPEPGSAAFLLIGLIAAGWKQSKAHL